MPTPSGSAKRSQRHQRHVELIALRVNAGWSREMLAYKAGVSRETIRMAEDGRWVPTPRVQASITAALAKQLEVKLTPLDLWPIEMQVAHMQARSVSRKPAEKAMA